MIYIVGHRGAAGIAPENTLAAFRRGLALGCDYVECDVHLTKDERLIVMHDATVDRTTNGTGAVADLTFEQIRGLDAGDGETVPTLEEVLKVIHDRGTLLIELKGPGVEDAAVDLALSRHQTDEVIFTSFHMDRIERVKRRGSHLATGAIFSDPTDDDIRRAKDLGASGTGVHYRNLRLRTVELAHELELDIRAWNPDTLHEQQAMIGLGVSGISTNRPDILIKYLRKTGDL